MGAKMGWVIGGAGSSERTSLQIKFPVNRENTGKLFNFGQKRQNPPIITACLQQFTDKFPKKDNRELFQESRELYLHNRERVVFIRKT